MERQEIHEKILYPVTRVRASASGGSGVLVYSEPDPMNPEEYINIALTCQHVIDQNIIVKDEWDGVLKRDMKRDVMQEVTVEIFDYKFHHLYLPFQNYLSTMVFLSKYQKMIGRTR